MEHSQASIKPTMPSDKEDALLSENVHDSKSINPESNSSVNKVKSNIVTLEPQEKVSLKKRKNFRSSPLLAHFDSLFGVQNWSRFLVLKTNQRISSMKLENILLSKCPTKEMSFRKVRPNEWLIETTAQNQSEIFLS